MSEWAALTFAVLTVLVSGAVAWGVTKTKVDGVKDRLDWLESQKYITREEFESRHKEVRDEWLRLFPK